MRLILLFVLMAPFLFGQQVRDEQYQAKVDAPAWSSGDSPLVLIDEAHHNFHTMDGRYKPFADLLRADGIRVEANRTPFSSESLRKADILVISNALSERNAEDWTLPTPSAFTPEEIEALRVWIEQGGALMMMVDHMPMPGCAEDLAHAFGITFSNGFAVKPGVQGPALFTTEAGTLEEHPILRGRNAEERVDSVATFTGSAFHAEPQAPLQPLLVFPEGWVSLETSEAWKFEDDTPRVPLGGWFQGATLEYGEGRIAIFGEAAMFTAQIAGGSSFGLNHPMAAQNQTFLLNVMHWLAGLLDRA